MDKRDQHLRMLRNDEAKLTKAVEKEREANAAKIVREAAATSTA